MNVNSVAVPWIAECVLITWRVVQKDQRPPLPSEFLATFIAFGTFSLIANSQPKIASALGWGIVVATFLNLFGTEDRLTHPTTRKAATA